MFGKEKIAENYEEEKKIVHAEGEFEDVTGDEFKRDLASLPEKNEARKGRGQADPHGAIGQGLAWADNAAAALEDQEIQRQHAQREQVEENPEVEQRTFLRELKIDDC
jgi:hypothetical protein